MKETFQLRIQLYSYVRSFNVSMSSQPYFECVCVCVCVGGGGGGGKMFKVFLLLRQLNRSSFEIQDLEIGHSLFFVAMVTN